MRVWLALLAIHAAHAWSLFGSEPEQPYLHHLSPPENDPAPFREKRQAYQVYVGDDVSVSVDKSGKAETGAWGPWTPENQCSRTCGGGVQIEKRTCSGDCTGPSTRYVSCSLEACAEDAADFRAEQCSKYNDEALNGNYYKWLPYKGKNKCELLCKPEAGNFYYKWADKVVDGTKCDSKSDDICVDGICLPLGCDGKLGSAKKADKCGVCDGDGSTCKTLEGIFDERNLSPGYHDIIKLPVGATNIKIEEMRDTSNNLALKNDSDFFFLNGNGMLSVEKDVEAAGTVFEYDDAKKEKLFAAGPLKEPLTVSLLFRKGNRDAAIKYEFSVPLEEVPYMWKVGEWSACSVTCGLGDQKREPFCQDVKTQHRVADDLCEELNVTKPETEKKCKTVDCEAEWFQGEWESCSQTCGDSGEQYRVVYCHKVFADGKRMTVEDANCTTERPAVRQQCNRFNCPEWHAGPWSACSEKCGDAFQYRSVTCRSEKEGEEAKLLAAEACNSDETIESQRSCNLGPCEGLKFFTTEWKLCEKCNDTEETREVTCKDTANRAYPLEKCLTDNTTEIPIDSRTCATQPPCIYEWTTSEWSKCSTECGHGHKNRKVFCAIHQLGGLTVVDEGQCQGEKPEARSNCTNEEKCTGTWYTGPWSKCTEECGGGSQDRFTVCLNYDKKPVPEWCDEADKPAEKQDCNTQDCPTCGDSEFGCCPDNSTFALGAFNEGCSNCSTSAFGCCADNYTEAIGPNFKGCAEYNETADLEVFDLKSADGSGNEPDDEETCTVTNENGEQATVSCAKNATLDGDDLFGNVTEPENITLHCSKSEFGCCPDWTTPAEGKENAGCPGFVLGTCNSTTNGCCPDGVTLARGPNYEGCGEPSCAASLYGCCKDRTTIAFGAHYAGCERSTFPCELSNFGCCPDGETAALSKNGTGCGENCLTTKFGCCPDGVTVAKGHHNKGCGCQYSRYGCCPDGKSEARGSGHYGCGNDCASSKFGCCPDGKTKARGENWEGCPCQYTRFGCCPDGETTALGPRLEGCNDCRYTKYGCCPYSQERARGPDHLGCPSTTPMPQIRGGTVAPELIKDCSLPENTGTVCHRGYVLSWYYDTKEGLCKQFWYGGCDGNSNRFPTEAACKEVCVEPPARGRCYLPKNEGPLRCDDTVARYFYDHQKKQCEPFWYRGCLGNANNFVTWEECSTFCRGIGPINATVTTTVAVPRAPDFEVQVPAATPAPVATPHPDTRPRPPMQICRSPADAGPCTESKERFAFDLASGSCKSFKYGGCGGNLNRFESSEDCMRRCSFLLQRPAEPRQSPSGPAPVPEVPRRQPEPRPTDVLTTTAPAAPIPSFDEQRDPRRNPAHPQHQQFLADRERAHRERHEQILEQRRQEQLRQQTESQSSVNLEAPVTPTAQRTRRPTAPTTAPLQRGEVGHSESGHPFKASSREHCSQPLNAGKCTGHFKMWYYEPATGQCEQFSYTGCGGNANRFTDRAKCEESCAQRAPPTSPAAALPLIVEPPPATSAVDNSGIGANSICDEPKDTGPCENYVTKWFYNKADGTCNRFHYGGCKGSANRFDTEEKCKAACSQHQDLCTLPKVAGPCSGRIRHYFFNTATRTCDEFFYGGCLGNLNRFATVEECDARCGPSSRNGRVGRFADLHPAENFSVAFIESQLIQMAESRDAPKPRVRFFAPKPARCFMPREAGACKASHQKYFYNADLNGCFLFEYTGCGGNQNRFESVLDCMATCAKDLTTTQKVPSVDERMQNDAPFVLDDMFTRIDEDEPKQLMADPPEEPKFERFEQSPASSSSASSEEVTVVPLLAMPELCLLPEQRGSCFGDMLRWRWDDDHSVCVSFKFTGCEPNANHFDSEEACLRACGPLRTQPICSLQKDAGNCDMGVLKWYFDSKSQECKHMMWGGCDGNLNRFSSKEECQNLCFAETSAVAGADLCEWTRDPGPCKDAVTQWYFDGEARTCRQFTYGGCRGNGNRFNTKEECEHRCDSKNAALIQLEDAREICHLPFEKGPCSSQTIAWFFDPNLGDCASFTYGGCKGNENRFLTRSACLELCSPFIKEVDELKYTVDIQPGNVVVQGDSVVLACSADIKPTIWLKDDNMLPDSRRYQIDAASQKLSISNVTLLDSGSYRCAVGQDGILSEPSALKVQASMICFDNGSTPTCALTVRMKLCGKKRYFQHCCGSCTLAGFPML